MTTIGAGVVEGVFLLEEAEEEEELKEEYATAVSR